jgi:hypothetical protein
VAGAEAGRDRFDHWAKRTIGQQCPGGDVTGASPRENLLVKRYTNSRLCPSHLTGSGNGSFVDCRAYGELVTILPTSRASGKFAST